jgi:hypothetical protein
MVPDLQEANRKAHKSKLSKVFVAFLIVSCQINLCAIEQHRLLYFKIVNVILSILIESRLKTKILTAVVVCFPVKFLDLLMQLLNFTSVSADD